SHRLCVEVEEREEDWRACVHRSKRVEPWPETVIRSDFTRGGCMRTPIARAVGLAALVFVEVAPRRVQGQTAPPAAGATAAAPEDRGLSLLLNVGGYTGFGGGLAFGTREMGIRGTVGWSPVLIALDNGSSTDFKFYSGFQAGPDVYLRIFSPQATSDIG